MSEDPRSELEIPEPTTEQRARREIGPIKVSVTRSWATATPEQIRADLNAGVADMAVVAAGAGTVTCTLSAGGVQFFARLRRRETRSQLRRAARARKLRRGWA